MQAGYYYTAKRTAGGQYETAIVCVHEDGRRTLGYDGAADDSGATLFRFMEDAVQAARAEWLASVP